MSRSALNFQEPYLRTIFGFIGVTDLRFIVADNLNQGEEPARQSREKAETLLRELIPAW